MKNFKYFFTFLFLVVFIYGFNVVKNVPKDFPQNETFLIEENESLKSVSVRLEQKHIITSALWFRVFVSFEGKDRNMQIGFYKFNEPITLGAVAKRIFQSGPDQPLIKVTIPEGNTNEDIAKKINEALPNISARSFLAKISEMNVYGKLFPETYFLLPSYDENRIINKMNELFDKKYLENFGNENIPVVLKNKEDVIILASIIEGEAKTKEDMQIVSGILQRRLKEGMRLQVDVATETYKQKGLPSKPVNNPGLNSIYAVFHPTTTNYLYYLTGHDGNMYYSKTFEEHKRNIQKYLR